MLAWTERLDGGRTQRLEGVATALVVALGFALTFAKAALAPITTDEAWNFNGWASHDFPRVFGDYSQPNNHILHTAAVRVSLLAFGPSELALRLPALAGYVLLLVAVALLARQLLRYATARVLCLAAIALHPYMIDFGALARGYTLGLGLALLGLVCAVRAARSPTRQVALGWLAVAGLCVGGAVGAVMLFVNLIAAEVCAAFVVLGRERPWRERALGLGAVILPALAVLAATYGHVLRVPGRLQFGALDLTTSLASLHRLFVYDTQSLLDAHGHPLVSGPIVPWQDGILSAAFGPLLAAPSVGVVLGVLVAAAIASAVVRAGSRERNAAALPGLMLAGVFGLAAAEHAMAGLPWPFHRTWIAAVPLAVLALAVATEALLEAFPPERRRAAGAALGAACALFIAVGCTRWNPSIYREWPDNAPVREVLDRIAAARAPGGSTSVGHPWYLDACFRYYREVRHLDWLELAPRPVLAEQPGAQFVLANRRTDMGQFAEYGALARWESLGVTLLQRKGGEAP